MGKLKVEQKAILLLALATFFWGLSFIVMKALALMQQRLAPGLSVWSISSLSIFLRFSISAAILVIFFFKQIPKISRKEMMQGLGLGFFGGIGLLFQMDGVNYTESSTAAFLTQAYCVILPVITALRLKKFPAPTIIFSSLMVLVGIGVLSNVKLTALVLGKGEAEVLLASLLFTVQILLLEMKTFKECDSNRVTLIMCLTTSLIMGGMLGFQNLDAEQCFKAYGSYQVILFITVLTIGCTLVPYLLMNRWQGQISATQAGLIYCVEPVFASLFALFLPAWISVWTRISFINETMDIALLWGGGLILGANCLMIWGSRRKSSE